MGEYADAANEMLALLKKIGASKKFTASRQQARALVCRAYRVEMWSEVRR